MFYSILPRLHDYVWVCLDKCRNVRRRGCAIRWWKLKLFSQWKRSTSCGSSQCTPVPPTSTLQERKVLALPPDPSNAFLSFHSSSLTVKASQKPHSEITEICCSLCAKTGLWHWLSWWLGNIVSMTWNWRRGFISHLASPHFGLIFLFIGIKGDLEPFVLCCSIYLPGFSEAAESTSLYITAC